MSVAFQSVQTTAYTSSGTVVVTTPTSLAVGDLMIGIVHGTNFLSTSPSGWTRLANLIGTGHNAYVDYKIATSGDVAAANFTWTMNVSAVCGGSISRITGANTVSTPVSASAEVVGGGAPATQAITITPATANSLLLYFLADLSSAAGTFTTAGYAIVTSNPTWTEQYDFSNGNGLHLALATATRPQTTATGNASFTATGAGGASHFYGLMVAVAPQITVSVADTVTTTDRVTKKPTRIFRDTVTTTDTQTTSKSKVWTKTNKTTDPTWTRTTKN